MIQEGRFHPSVVAAVKRLSEMAVPVISFAQTVFWDDPMKAILLRALREAGADNRFIAGIHDTDYFSKLPHFSEGENQYLVVTRNDGSTRELWAATVETSALFGSETPTPVARLQEHGVTLAKLKASKNAAEAWVDEVTEAWGWRAVAYRGEHAPVAHDVRLADVIGPIQEMIDGVTEETLRLLYNESTDAAAEHRRAAEQWKQLLQDEASRHSQSNLNDFYAAVMPRLYCWLLDCQELAMENAAGLETTTCSRHFRFTEETCSLSRFKAVDCFLNASMRPVLCEEYDRAVAGSGIYPLDRFGEGALPFDLMVPGKGRGTLRVGQDQSIISFPHHEILVAAGRRIEDVASLAQAIQERFGDNCALVGKALVLPVMLASEGVMVLHEGASVYIPRTQQWVRRARARLQGRTDCMQMPLYPLLRMHYQTWDSLEDVGVAFNLPSHMRESFGARSSPLSGRAFARLWREVLEDQQRRLETLARTRSVRELLEFLATHSSAEVCEQWDRLLQEYVNTTQAVYATAAQLDTLSRHIDALKRKRRELENNVTDLEQQTGELRRRLMSVPENVEGERPLLASQRQALLQHINALRSEIKQVEAERKALGTQANALRLSSKYHADRQRLHEIELEAEEERLRLVRNALLIQGLDAANHRPCSWWFPVVDPSMHWWQEVMRTTQAYFEEW